VTDIRIIVPAAVPVVSIETIPAITLGVGETYYVYQFVTDDSNVVTGSQILGIDTGLATYSHATGRITGVATGSMTGLQLEVTH